VQDLITINSVVSLNNKYRFILFCHEHNEVCISANIILQEYLKDNRNKLDVELEIVDEMSDIVKFKRYKIQGVPTLLILKDQRIVKRWLGEISYEKLENTMQAVIKN